MPSNCSGQVVAAYNFNIRSVTVALSKGNVHSWNPSNFQERKERGERKTEKFSSLICLCSNPICICKCQFSTIKLGDCTLLPPTCCVFLWKFVSYLSFFFYYNIHHLQLVVCSFCVLPSFSIATKIMLNIEPYGEMLCFKALQNQHLSFILKKSFGFL